MKKVRLMIILAVFLIVFTRIAGSVSAPAYRTIEYRGVASVNGTPVGDGTEVSIWANNGSLMMDKVYTQAGIGFYDHLEIIWDNLNTTGVDEGVYPDEVTLENITFKINGVNVTNPSYVTVKLSERGDLKYLDLDTNLTVNDTSAPVINLISPANLLTDIDGNISFQYNVSDMSNISNCYLYINGTLNGTHADPQKDTTNTFSRTLGNGSYNWQVNCTDIYGNNGSSELRILRVTILSYIVTVTPWETLVSGKPTGVNVTVMYSNGSGISNAIVDAVEVNGYTAFALPQRIDSNVTNIVTARTYTNQNGFVMFTIAPTGGSGLIGSEDKIGNYSIYVDVTVGGVLVNRTYLNNTDRDLKDATGVVGSDLPSRSDIVTFHNLLAVVYDKVNDWLI